MRFTTSQLAWISPKAHATREPDRLSPIVPLTSTTVPPSTGPWLGTTVTARIGGCDSNTSLAPSKSAPPLFDISTVTFPLRVGGAAHTTLVELSDAPFTSTSPKRHTSMPELTNPSPTIVTACPPSSGPCEGQSPLTRIARE